MRLLKNRQDSRRHASVKTAGHQKKKHETVLIGDSHIKGCANTLQSKLKDQYEVTGYVKPGAEIQTLT
jgi:hypothetical protein